MRKGMCAACKAPPRKNCAPEAATCSAMAKACSRLSMEQGPAMMASVAAADSGIRSRKADDGVFFLHVAAGQLVGLGDADHFGDAGELFQVAALHFALVAGDADGGALGSGKRMGAEAQLLNGSQTAWISSCVACAFITTSMAGSSNPQSNGWNGEGQ